MSLNCSSAWVASTSMDAMTCTDNNGVSQQIIGTLVAGNKVIFCTDDSSGGYIFLSVVVLLTGQPPFALSFVCPYTATASETATVSLYMARWYTGNQF